MLSLHYEYLADLDKDEVHITGMTMLDRTEHIQTRIKILQQKLEKQRLAKKKRPQSPTADDLCAPENSTEGPSQPKRTRKSNKEKYQTLVKSLRKEQNIQLWLQRKAKRGDKSLFILRQLQQ